MHFFPFIYATNGVLTSSQLKSTFVAGRCVIVHDILDCCLPWPVRHASVYSLQSAGEAQSVPAGYQTDTRHSRAGLWDTGSCLRGNVPSYANTTEQLHTSPPRD
jgi:hypothetical protein